MRISLESTDDSLVSGVFSRVLASLDRVPAVSAFGFMAVCGTVETMALFRRDVGATAPWYARATPLAAFGMTVLLGLSLILTSRSAVVHRESGTFWERCVAHVQHLGRIVTFHAAVAVVLIVPALVMTNAFDLPTTQVPVAKGIVSATGITTSTARRSEPSTAASSAISASPSTPATTEAPPPPPPPVATTIPAPSPSPTPSGTNSVAPPRPGALKQPGTLKAPAVKAIPDKPPMMPSKSLPQDGTE